MSYCKQLHPLPDNQMLAFPKLKAFADNKLNITQNFKSVLVQLKNIVGKGENNGYQHFLLFPECFQKSFISETLKAGIVSKRLQRQ